MESRDGHQVIERAASLLRCLVCVPGGLSIAALSRETGLARTTVSRLVGSLRREAFVSVDDGKVRLGPALVRLARAANLDAVALARPHLERLSEALDETVDLWVERADACELVDQVVADQEVRVCLSVGARLPMHTTACGKALLAGRTDEELAARLPKTLSATTPKSIGRREALIEHLNTVREAGIAVDDEEHASGVCAIGVALELPLPDRYAVCVPMPTDRFHAKRERATSALLACVRSIEEGVAG